MDSLFKSGNPTFLLDGLIRSHHFAAWVDVHEAERGERMLWEMFLFKLGAWDERSFEEYKRDVLPQPVETTTEEQLFATVQNSVNILKDFNPEERG